ncbi:hypothetical protein [Yoonia litorea]|uniref:Uncharacterized protein n=1 Tax=Yoonia litorea TaxID=1123755 RepID=A0A1I6MHH2_9RHOB|nr:hypothetical protein [Yoonia litorea]SFS15093.1 hypothetical protein SAMN05444714_1802 [Yoonia litorea]
MIFLRAFPFSFSILWRYAIALPALILSLVAFGVIAVVLVLVASVLSPFAGALIIVAFSVGASVVPLMVGLRVGLQAHHIKPRRSYLGLIAPAIGYGFFEAVVILILLALGAGLFVLVSPLDLAGLMMLGAESGDALFTELTAINAAVTWGVTAAVALIAMALRAALLVPLAGASIGADPTGRPHTPFYGFGSGFGAVFALVVVSQLGLIMVVPLVFSVMAIFGMGEAAMLQLASIATMDDWADLANLGTEAAIFVAASLFATLFFFSLQCAGAVLVFVRKMAVVGARQQAFDSAMQEREEELQTAKVPQSDTDLLALVRSRMPEKKYDT